MINRSHKIKSHSSSYLIILGLIVLLMWIISCKTLQTVESYENYTKNTDWKTAIKINNHVAR